MGELLLGVLYTGMVYLAGWLSGGVYAGWKQERKYMPNAGGTPISEVNGERQWPIEPSPTNGGYDDKMETRTE